MYELDKKITRELNNGCIVQFFWGIIILTTVIGLPALIYCVIKLLTE